MTQTEQVIGAMREAGGSATFEKLNCLIDFSNWKTQTPEATVRRIVQESDAFFKIRPGLWGLIEYKGRLTNDEVYIFENIDDHSDANKKENGIVARGRESSGINAKLSYLARF